MIITIHGSLHARENVEQFLRETEELKEERIWQLLKAGVLKRETKSLIYTAQDQAYRTNSVKHAVDKLNISPSVYQFNAGSAKRKLRESHELFALALS